VKNADRVRTNRPLEGRTILVTRSEQTAPAFAEQLSERGAIPILAPAIEVVRAEDAVLDGAIEGLSSGRFEWVLFTSRSGVQAVAGRLAERGMNGSWIHASVGAVGEGTAQELQEFGIRAALVPHEFTTRALGDVMPAGSGDVLVARADIATEDLESALSAKGWTPVRLNAYRTLFRDRMPPEAAEMLRDGGLDAITFTSASTVEGFMKMVGSLEGFRSARAKVVCIGPVTAAAAKEEGLAVASIADPHTIDGLLAALEALFT
jgi:uroporphyrinogen-III synthase